MLCCRCGGTGKYMGNGMMVADCNLCTDGQVQDNNLDDKKNNTEISKIDRRSKTYLNAIREIKKLNPKLTNVECQKMFDDAYQKV